MKNTTKLVLSLLLAGAFTARSSGAEEVAGSGVSAALTIVLAVEPGSDVAEDDVRRAVAGELGARVVVSGESRPPHASSLAVSSKSGILSVTYKDDRGRTVRRELTAPADGLARVRTIALLAGNLARNEADELASRDTKQPADDARGQVVLRVAPGEVARAEIDARPAPRATVVAAPVVVPQADEDPGSTQRTVGWVTLGAGALAGGAGAVLASVARGHLRDLQTTCAPNCSESEVDSVSRESTLATVLLVGGGALAVTGIVLVLTAPRARDARAVAFGLGPGNVRLVGSF